MLIIWGKSIRFIFEVVLVPDIICIQVSEFSLHHQDMLLLFIKLLYAKMQFQCSESSGDPSKQKRPPILSTTVRHIHYLLLISFHIDCSLLELPTLFVFVKFHLLFTGKIILIELKRIISDCSKLIVLPMFKE